MNSQKPVMVSLADRDAGPVSQSRRTSEEEAVVVRLNMFGSKDSEVTWAKVEPRSLVTSMPVKAEPPVSSSSQVRVPVLLVVRTKLSEPSALGQV